MIRLKLCSGFVLLFATSLPARTIHVSVRGNDEADGVPDRPVRTISHAATLAAPGDVILVRPGIYRERVAPPRGGEAGSPITYRAEKLGTVFIRGSELWNPEWRDEGGGVYSAAPDASLFNDDCYVDSANPFLVPLSSTPYARDGKPESERFGEGRADLVYTCGQVIVDGVPWRQQPFLAEARERPKTWHYHAGESRVYVNFGGAEPGDHLVEITCRRRIFAPHVRGLGYIVVGGFVMEHCGNQYPTNFWREPKWAQAGALGLRGGHHWTVRNNNIRYANADGIDIGSGGGDNERDSRVAGGAPFGEDNVF